MFHIGKGWKHIVDVCDKSLKNIMCGYVNNCEQNAVCGDFSILLVETGSLW